MESCLAPKLLLFLVMAVEGCYGAVLLSSLPETLVISASSNQGQVLRAGEDSIRVTWKGSTTSSYRRVKAVLCYAGVSQVDRPWRKTVDNLSKDKTCQFTLFTSLPSGTVDWRITHDIPGATYFVRAYAYDDMESSSDEVAYGQTSTTFEIQAITAIHWRLQVLSICGSLFPLVSLLGFALRERTNSKRSF